MSRASTDGRIRQVNGHLVVEPGRLGATREIDAIFRELAVFCIEKQIRRVLVKPADEDPVGERALRVAMTTMVLAGLPAEFRLALVTDNDSIEARYRNTERDLCAAGVDAKVFASPEGATRWLDEI
jgi:hypothetical protein